MMIPQPATAISTSCGLTATPCVRPPSNTQLHTAPGWAVPPLDGSITVPELYDWHFEHNAEHPIFTYSESNGSVRTLRFREVVPAAHRAGWLVARLTGLDFNVPESARRTVAMLCSSDTITYFTSALGMLRAAIPFMPISPRNSSKAIAHLLKCVRPTHVFTSEDATIQNLLTEALALMRKEGTELPVVLNMPVYEDIYLPQHELVRLPARVRNLDIPRIVVHSSGSTSFPKPINWTDRTCIEAAMAPWYGTRSHVSMVFATHCLAMYHGIGINFMNWISMTGLIMAVFPPSSPAIIPSFSNVWEGAVKSSADYIFAPPIFFELWSQDEERVKYLSHLKQGIVFGGAPMSKATGDYLAKAGCSLYSLYGITEAGVLCTHFPDSPGMDWEYIRMNQGLSTVFSPQGDGTSELLVIASHDTEILVINARWEGLDAYATNDVFLPHPTKPNHWKLIGRKDDQLMLSTGEKTNPTPLEAILCQDSYVAASVMFGRGRFQNGILIQLKPDHLFNPCEENNVIKYRNLVWPSVEKMNQFAPSHSRLFKEMIIFSDPLKPFSFNAKGAPQRSVILSAYSSEIEALYQTVEDRIDEQHPSEWTLEASLVFVRRTVNKNLPRPAGDVDDIFECGCDSLQATWIRNALIHALRDKRPLVARSIGSNFVYEHPRIRSIAELLTESHDDITVLVEKDPSTRMISTLAKFAAPGSFAQVVPSRSVLTSVFDAIANYSRFSLIFPPGDTILITGTTGSLGAAVLAKLIQATSVRKIFALNRPSKMALLDRQREAFKSRGYDVDLASSSKLILIESDITEGRLGVPEALDREIRTTTTHIIHIAWRVDFNLNLSSYESILRGMRVLVNLALTSPQPRTPKFIFTSSVGVLRRVPAGIAVPEKALDNPKVAVGQGYGESKWIGEQMLYTAARETGLRPLVLRVGQIAGGVNGGWNSSDWVPVIIKSSLHLGYLPKFHGTCTWLPLDVAASAILDYRHAPEGIDTAHLVHPHAQASQEIFQTVGEALDLPLVPYPAWLEKLEAVPLSQHEDVPALKLLDFFKAASVDDSVGQEAIGIPPLKCENASAMSGHLRQANPIQKKEVLAWLDYWKSIGFLKLNKLA